MNNLYQQIVRNQFVNGNMIGMQLSRYWLCDLNSVASTQIQICVPTNYIEVFTPQPQIYHASERIISKNEENLVLLKDFPYTSYVKECEKTNRPVIMYKCEYDNCGKEFNRTWNLLDHAMAHQKIRPNKCMYCEKSFTQKGNLKKHMKVHEIPIKFRRGKFTCPKCGSSYSEKYNYKVSQSLQTISKSLKMSLYVWLYSFAFLILLYEWSCHKTHKSFELLYSSKIVLW